jgi:DNA-binding NarL/FixJ family response regulator
VGEAASGLQAIAQADALKPDVILMDIGLPDMTGIEAARRIRIVSPASRVLILTVSDRNEDLMEALRAGARGYMLKSMEGRDVQEAIHRVAAGEALLPPHLTSRLLDELAAPAPPGELTDREQDVLRYLAKGWGNKEVAAALHVSENTIKTHVRHILDKLNLRSRAEAAVYAVQAGLVTKQ